MTADANSKRHSNFRTLFFLSLSLSLVALGCGESNSRILTASDLKMDMGGITPAGDHKIYSQSLTPDRLPTEKHVAGSIVFGVERELEPSTGDLVETRTGVLTPAMWQRIARPWSHSLNEEEYLYDEEIRGSDLGHVTQRVTHKIYRRSNPLHGQPAGSTTPSIRMNVETQNLLATSGDFSAPVAVKMRDFPDWNVPLRLPSDLFAVAQQEQALIDRHMSMEARRTNFEMLTAELSGAIESRGGEVVGKNWAVGWIFARVNRAALSHLSTHASVGAVYSGDQPTQDQCDSTCNLVNESNWKLGSGDNSPGGRDDVRLNADSFINAGYDGGAGNPNGRLRAVVVETFPFEDEALSFRTASSSYYRYHSLNECSSSSCSQVVDLDDESANAGHASMVTNILLGDLEDGQANTFSYGDSCYSAGHCEDWERAGSGMAPEASLGFYAAAGESAATHAYTRAVTSLDDNDVLNASHSFQVNDCDVTSSSPAEDAAEVVYDDGIFFVGSAGNNENGGSTQCDLNGPGDTPKVFTVNAFNAGVSACEADFLDCPLATDKHRMGGMDATLPSSTKSGAISGVDVVAPDHVLFELEPDGAYGQIDATDMSFGTSAAVPHVAGLALLVKDWQLANSNTWINSPGRLHAFMLGMTDRASSVSSHATTGADDLWGLGRVKLQLGQRSRWNMRTTTRTTTGTTSFMLASTPFPSNTALLKCVMHESEDMSSKSTVGDVWMRVTLRQPQGGTCSPYGTFVKRRTDASYDLKHMVRFHDAFTNMDGLCAEIELVHSAIAGSSITTHTYCYASSEYDTDPH